MPDVFTKEKRSELMSRIRSKGSKMEVEFTQLLKSNNIEFTYQPKIFGKPDFLLKPNIVIFCDSSFWHGRNWKMLKNQLKEGYWRDHIAKNMKRDRLVSHTLRKEGFVVLRFWDDEIKEHPEDVTNKIQRALKEQTVK
jgi:DNA mismatch endonuclease (patch repair protein)